MKTSFTPGPWRISATYQGFLTDRFKGFPFVIDSASGFQPALIFGDGKSNHGMAEANARLIAAAPALLAALDDCLRKLQTLHGGGAYAPEAVPATINQARAALTLATEAL